MTTTTAQDASTDRRPKAGRSRYLAVRTLVHTIAGLDYFDALDIAIEECERIEWVDA